MGSKANLNMVNQFAKGTEIYTEGDSVFSVALILKGRVRIINEGANIVVGIGAFLGVQDLYTGKFQSTYTADEDVLLYVFAISKTEELEFILSINKDYHGFMVAAFNKLIYDLEHIYQGAIKNCASIYRFLEESYKEYLNSSERLGYKAVEVERFSNLYIPQDDLEILRDRINYYLECRSLPIDVVKAFYSYGNAVTLYQVEDQVNIINQQIETLKEISCGLISLVKCMADESDTCLFQLVATFAMEINKTGDSNKEVMDILDNIIDEVNTAEKFIDHMLGQKLTVNKTKMEKVYHLLLTRASGKEIDANLQYSKEDMAKALTELKDSFQTILDYAEIIDDRAEEMKNTMQDFIGLKDRSSTEDNIRVLRRQLANNHYELYKLVFLKEYHSKKESKVIDLFLKYGYADERLLSNEQLLSLYFLEEDTSKSTYNVYNIKEWLTLIYEGKKEPSKNEFDLEYPEMVASLKKQAKLTEKEAKEWLVDPERKLDYEILNMFRYNNRITNGQIGSFVPILHKELMGNDLRRLQVTATKVSDSINELLRTDYSIFDREVLYVNKEKKIAKEYIVKRVYPDIILMPNMGINGVMWQEITGKRRDSAGRFLLPIFTDSSPTALFVRVFGRYHWELCRCMEGSAWNDIKHKSLTSEYSDYLQFYRKNKELSEEKKEKIKLQIQKGRNSNREIFVIDYEQWINYESRGAVKLNKPVRELMATYCPFSKEIREQIKLQPMFEEAMARYFREKQKKIREIESRYRLLQKEQIELTSELEETLIYYKDL